MYAIKIRHAFESHYRNQYGYYPTWDQRAGEYFVRTTQEMWDDWQSFFQAMDVAVMKGVAPQAMTDLFTNRGGSSIIA